MIVPSIGAVSIPIHVPISIPLGGRRGILSLRQRFSQRITLFRQLLNFCLKLPDPRQFADVALAGAML